MFETSEMILNMIGVYAAVGFCLAVLYNTLRFFRLAFPELRTAAAVSDFLFAVAAGLTLFIFSVDMGTGFFRLYYVAAAAFGFALNMVTLGLVVPPAAKLSGRLWRAACGKIRNIAAIPIGFICEKTTYFFAKAQKNISKVAEICKKYLKKRHKIVYNIEDHKIGKLYPEGGEHRNAIKAKVRKII